MISEDGQLVAGDDLVPVSGSAIHEAQEMQRRLQHLGHDIEGEKVRHEWSRDLGRDDRSKEFPDLETKRRIVVRNQTQQIDLLELGDGQRVSILIGNSLISTQKMLSAKQSLLVRIRNACGKILLDGAVVSFSRFHC